MATVNWPNAETGIDNSTQQFRDYGFDLRDILYQGVAFPTFINQDGTGFTNYETAHSFLTTDKFGGSFVVKREGVEYGTPPATIFIGKEWVDSGTITSFTRTAGKILGTIEGLQIDYLQAAAAASTADKSDDMALWAQAFAGNDFLYGSNGADRLEGFLGNDTMLGGAGNDSLDGGEGTDVLNAELGSDTVYGANGDDTLLGDTGDDWLDGGTGRDVIVGGEGNDTLYGNSDQDSISGGRGADKLYGGTGNDCFIYVSIKDSSTAKSGRDTIVDFSSKQKDKIDFRAIDASTKSGGNQAFKFIDKQGFHKKAGELRWEKVAGGVNVYGDVNGDGKSDFSIFMKGLTKLTKGDFYL